jgi:uncharacterized protein
MTRAPDFTPIRPDRTPVVQRRWNSRAVTSAAWTTWVVLALALLPVATGAWYAAWVGLSAVAIALWRGTPRRGHVDGLDLVVVSATYLAVVALMWAAFQGFTTARVLGLFLCFAAALLLGVLGPLLYTVWIRRRSLADLGLRLDNWRPTVALALLFAGVQFGLTLWGYDLPGAADWVPLLGMALVVGAFEAVFFRGFVQGRLEHSFGTGPGTAVAAGLYGLYHVGYGMAVTDIMFLTGLGLVYAVAYRLVGNVLVLWPLLTPLGSFFANLEGGDIDLPWASLAGFGDVFALMVLGVWLAARHVRRSTGPLHRTTEGKVS